MHAIDGRAKMRSMLPGVPELASIDLNLLVALEALLAERSVTRAARRLGLTQPSTSHALGRLRELLGDPLLVRVGRAMVATPRAEALEGALSRALGDLRSLLVADPAFDPSSTRRAFSIACPDLLATLVPDLVARFASEAPHAALELRSPIIGDLAAALGGGGIDLALAPSPSDGAGLVVRSLGTVRWCVLARRDHPGLRRGRLSVDAWGRWPHVVVRTGSDSSSVVGRVLATSGIERRIGLVVPGFLVVPRIIARTDLLAAAPRELVAPLARELDLAILEPPLPIPPIRVAAIWHDRYQVDPAHQWLRGIAIDVVSSVSSPASRRR